MLDLDNLSLDDDDLVTIARAAAASASANTLSIGGLARALSELNQYGQSRSLNYGSTAAPAREEENTDGV